MTNKNVVRRSEEQIRLGIFTLHRYYIWANRMRVHFDEVLARESVASDANAQIESFMYMSYWYASLYVVIEGWRELKLNDETINSLLASSNVDLLKRYRHGTFHFQRDYSDRRFAEFMEGEKPVEWIRAVNREFGRYFLDALKV